MATDLTPEREAEIDNAELAVEELEKTGKTDRRCLTCGGEIRFEDLGSGYRIWCTKENRVLVSARGI